MPKVTVAIPSYNLAPFIAQAVEGVLAQTFQDWELLIEDDGSTDDSVEVLARFNDPRIKIVTRSYNLGANPTTNSLVKAASGEYIALLAADDYWEPEKLAKQVAYLDANPSCGIVFGYPAFIDQRGSPIELPDLSRPPNLLKEGWQERFRWGNCLFISTSMYRRSLHDALGYFSDELGLLADLEWYVRIVKEHDLYVMEETLAYVRCRDNQANLSAPTMANAVRNCDELEIIRERHYKVTRKTPKLMIATPFYDVKGFSPYITSLVQTVHMLTLAKQEFEFIELSGDSYVWRARNLIAERFINSDCTHLMFIDSDEGWSLESFVQVWKANAEVVGGVYPTKNNWEQYGCTVYTDEAGVPDRRADGLLRAQKVPTGFMKISRAVFEKLKEMEPENWYWEGGNDKPLRRMQNYFGHIIEDHIAFGEDISFCRRCEKAGIELYIEPRCSITHIGTKVWAGNYHEYLLRRPGGSKDPAKAAA